jgi:Putative peptidoglycan binding domain
MNAGLPTDGIASPDFRAALRNFQGQQGLPVSGFAGPDTIAALRRAGGSPPQQEFMVQQQVELVLPRFNVLRNKVTVDVGDGKREQPLKGVTVAAFEKVSPIWRNVLLQLEGVPAHTWKKDGKIVNLKTGAEDMPPSRSGLYRITFGGPGNFNGKENVYHGKSGKLRGRILQHAREVAQMGFSLVNTHHVRWLEPEPPYNQSDYLIALEKCIIAYFLFRKHRAGWLGVTNIELETEISDL